MKFECLSDDDGQSRDAALIVRQPLRNDLSQIGFTTNRKIKSERVYVGPM